VEVIRRIELWISFACCTAIGGTFGWLAIAKRLPFLWWFAGPFLVLIPLMVWKATRPDRAFEEESEKLQAFSQRHPIWAALLALVTIAGALWTLCEMIGSIVSFLAR
jgi:hypothetical protein